MTQESTHAAAPQSAMSFPQDEVEKAYLEERAETEIYLAQASTHPGAVRAHYLLAGYYLDRLYGQDNDADEGKSARA